jgi:hypothetical protein
MRESDYDRFIRNVTGYIVVIGLLGAVGIASLRGVRTGIAFLIGAAVSGLSFWGWQQLVNALTPGVKKRSSWFFTLRLLVLLAAAYAIIKFFGLNLAAAAVGLLVSSVAAIYELIVELIFYA